MSNSPAAFIGLGIMGGPMAGHLLAAGIPLSVHTRTKSKAQPLIDRGARWAETPAEAARGAAAVFLCLPDTRDVEQVVEGESGVLGGADKESVVVDHSTISPAATRKLAEAASEQGVS